MAPRMFAGDHSVIYTGSVDWMAPTPTPARILAPVQSLQSRAKVSMSNDPARSTHRTYRVTLRPMRSEMGLRRSIPTSWPSDCIAPQRAVYCAFRYHRACAFWKPKCWMKPWFAITFPVVASRAQCADQGPRVIQRGIRCLALVITNR